MRLAGVFGDAGRPGVPAAGVAAWRLLVAAVAGERTAPGKLFQPAAWIGAAFSRVERQVQLVSARIAAPRAELFEQRRIMVMHPARHDALAVAERTGDAELSGNGLADEGALIR